MTSSPSPTSAGAPPVETPRMTEAHEALISSRWLATPPDSEDQPLWDEIAARVRSEVSGGVVPVNVEDIKSLRGVAAAMRAEPHQNFGRGDFDLFVEAFDKWLSAPGEK